MPLSERFQSALEYAAQLHANQVRKGSSTPYVAHLLGVASLVLEFGGDEDTAIAALLHDAVEDQGGPATRAEIAARFGERVARLVDGCTDADVQPKPPWQPRKEAYLAHLRRAPPEVRLISAADKLYNALSILRDHRRIGGEVWKLFNASRAQTRWYYSTVLEVLSQGEPPPLLPELQAAIEKLLQLE